MADERPAPAPDAVPRSPTGRVPQWVLDEAAGRPVEAVPFRGGASTPGLRPPPPRAAARPARTARLALALAFAGTVAAGGLYLQGGWPASTTEQDQQASSPPPPTSEVQPAPPAPAVEPDAPTPGLDEAAAPLGTPPSVPAMREGADYRFMRTQDDGAPVTWSPCRPIRYVVRPDHEPAAGRGLISRGLARISAATGLRFEDGGRTAEAPVNERELYQPDRYGRRWAPVLIAWATADEVPEFRSSTYAAQAGPTSLRTPDGDLAHVSGEVYLDPEAISQIVADAGPALAEAVVVHELGHLVGLAHVNNAAELMAPEATTITDLGPGDRAGLAALGRGPCQPDV